MCPDSHSGSVRSPPPRLLAAGLRSCLSLAGIRCHWDEFQVLVSQWDIDKSGSADHSNHQHLTKLVASPTWSYFSPLQLCLAAGERRLC